jgi:hypothetical protein
VSCDANSFPLQNLRPALSRDSLSICCVSHSDIVPSEFWSNIPGILWHFLPDHSHSMVGSGREQYRPHNAGKNAEYAFRRIQRRRDLGTMRCTSVLSRASSATSTSLRSNSDLRRKACYLEGRDSSVRIANLCLAWKSHEPRPS